MLLEVKILTHLNQHPNITKLLEVVPFGDDQIYLILSLAKYDLKHRICLGKPFDESEIQNISYQMFLGLGAVHASGVVHRDMKPGNVLIATNGVAQIADFGCAVACDSHEEGYNNVDTETTGTPDYHSPELLLASTRNAYALDMWAAGAILIEMSTLHKMIRAETAEEPHNPGFKPSRNPLFPTFVLTLAL